MTKELIVRITDAHVPYHSEKALELCLDYCKRKQPDIIIIDEWHDFYDLSKYDKNPSRKQDLQEELHIVEGYFAKLREYCLNSRIILLDSNHLDRLRRYLWNKAPELHSLEDLQIENLLKLRNHRIEFMKEFTYKGVLYKHGNVVRKYSGYSARGEFEKENMSGVSGHTHRQALYFHTTRSGQFFWMESGSTCLQTPEYIEGTPNWQMGISQVIYIDNIPCPKLLPIINGVIVE